MSFTSIRRAIVASTLVFGAAATLSPAAFAGTTGNVPISGSVVSNIALTSTPKAAASTLTLAPGTATQSIQVADLTMGTNNVTGLTLTASQSGGFKMTSSANGAQDISFQVGVGVGTSAPASYGDTGTTYSTNVATLTNSAYGLWVQYTPDSLQAPGAYNAAIDLTVTDN